MLQLRTFGGATLSSDGTALEGPASQRRRIALLSLLAVAGSRGMSRDTIISLLWPDSEPERARHALSQWLFLLRRDLGINDLVLGGNDLRLNPQRITADVIDFDIAVAKHDHTTAAQLYTGVFLEGFVLSDAGEFDRWIDRERAFRHREAVAAMEAVARDTEIHDPTAALELWQRLAVLDPVSARFAAKTIAALRDAGDHAAALAHARRHEEILRRELDMPPSSEVRALIEELRVVAPSLARVSRGGESEPHIEFVRHRLGHAFTIERVATHGSLAKDFDAVRLADNAPVSLRVLAPDIVVRSEVDRLLSLLGDAARLEHPHIAPLGEPGSVDGLLYLVSPRSSGRTLRDRLDAEDTIPPVEALQLGATLGAALSHAATAGIPHLDVTPRRVLIGDVARLADIGVMHALNALHRHRPTDNSPALGTPAYMSPEQLEGNASVGSAADVYSLACVLFHALTGRPPHASDNSRRLIATRLGSGPLSARDYGAHISPDADVLLARMLSRSAADRPAIHAVAGELSRVAAESAS
jgi:serine/threonine-protein kinase